MKKVLVIGGSYFVGRVFVEELLKAGGYEITVLNRGRIPMRKEGVVELKCDRRDPARMREVLGGAGNGKGRSESRWDALVDFCAYKPEDIAGVITALPQGAVGHYIFVSTASVYAKTNELPVMEGAPKLQGPQPELGPSADYAYDKWRTEVALGDECAPRGIPFTSIRPAFIYGKYNYAPRESYFFDLILRDDTVVVPDERLALFSFVSVWDAARIIIGCMGNEQAFGRAFNAAAEDLVSYPRLMEVLETVTGRDVRTRTMSVADINANNIPLPFPMDEHLIYSGALVREAFGFRYTPFLDGMRETYRYYLLGRKTP